MISCRENTSGFVLQILSEVHSYYMSFSLVSSFFHNSEQKIVAIIHFFMLLMGTKSTDVFKLRE